MEAQMKAKLGAQMADFRLPRYAEIPDVGLYLEQTTKYVAACLSPIAETEITSSMISNYVKRGLIDKPVKKQYSREQIAYLIYIATAKTVLTMDNIQLMMSIQKRTYPPETAYNYFCSEFENILAFVFGSKDSIDSVGEDNTEEKMMLQKTIIAVAHKIYLDKLLAALQTQEEK